MHIEFCLKMGIDFPLQHQHEKNSIKIRKTSNVPQVLKIVRKNVQ